MSLNEFAGYATNADTIGVCVFLNELDEFRAVTYI